MFWLIISEKLHADRSGHFVNEPSKINVSSPRTSLIPQRLFNFVAQIVQCHGRNPDAILELAKYNDGMDAEDYAHPRYIAALLRIEIYSILMMADFVLLTCKYWECTCFL